MDIPDDHVAVSVKKVSTKDYVAPPPVFHVIDSSRRMSGPIYTSPVHTSYIHIACGAETKIGPTLSLDYAENPEAHSSAICSKCLEHFPLNQFVWKDTQRKMGV